MHGNAASVSIAQVKRQQIFSVMVIYFVLDSGKGANLGLHHRTIEGWANLRAMPVTPIHSLPIECPILALYFHRPSEKSRSTANIFPRKQVASLIVLVALLAVCK